MLLAALACPATLRAQGAPTHTAGLDLVAVDSDPAQALLGGSAWWRPSPRMRLGGGLAAGTAGGAWAGRVEVAAHFLLAPTAVRGVGIYGGGGLALSLGDAGAERMMVTVGVEARPGSRHGWVVELGLAGGMRVAVGWRWRWRARR